MIHLMSSLAEDFCLLFMVLYSTIVFYINKGELWGKQN